MVIRNEGLSQNWNALLSMIISTLNIVYKLRPTCAEILAGSNHWLICIDQVKNEDNFKKVMNQLRDFENKFFFEYIFDKLI